jgi:serine/threonine-protein kinase
VHRDVKPANVVLTRDEHGQLFARLLDFGVARASRRRATARHHTGRGMVLGTPATMSPEQARGLPIDGRADVWALACVAYEGLTARTVVDDGSPESALVKLCTFDLAPLRDEPVLPAPLRALFAQAFARDLAARFQSADAFAHAFAAAHEVARAEMQALGRGSGRRMRRLVVDDDDET